MTIENSQNSREDTPSEPVSETITRGEVWAVLAEQAGVEPELAQTWVVENGISDGTVPDRNISREEFAAMLWVHKTA